MGGIDALSLYSCHICGVCPEENSLTHDAADVKLLLSSSFLQENGKFFRRDKPSIEGSTLTSHQILRTVSFAYHVWL